jgi:hypothetical protein
MDELDRECAKHDAERAQYTAQTNALFEVSNRLHMATDAAREMQENLRQEMADRISCQDRILQLIQSWNNATENDTSSPV